MKPTISRYTALEYGPEQKGTYTRGRTTRPYVVKLMVAQHYHVLARLRRAGGWVPPEERIGSKTGMARVPTSSGGAALLFPLVNQGPAPREIHPPQIFFANLTPR